MKKNRTAILFTLALFLVVGISSAEASHSPSHERTELMENIKNLGNEIVREIPIPILFGVNLGDFGDNFGELRNGGSRIHEGLDIFAPNGTPIVSPTNAVVISVGEGARSGKYVYTSAPGGETFAYMHLQRHVVNMKRGDVLERGGLVGFVGNTGNAMETPAHIHFEIRRNGPKNPYNRIKREFTIAEKMIFLGNILNTEEHNRELAGFILNNFSRTIKQVPMSNIPEVMRDVIIEKTEEVVDILRSDIRDLTIGSRGSDVEALQIFLIINSDGPDRETLERVGATGYFGSITHAALAEYQAHADISSTFEHYGTTFRDYIFNMEEIADLNVGNMGSFPDIIMPDVNLYVGLEGEDVMTLQKFLINKSTGSNVQDLKRVGATGYFGSITRNALADYQAAVGIFPASGYYGPITRSYISENV